NCFPSVKLSHKRDKQKPVDHNCSRYSRHAAQSKSYQSAFLGFVLSVNDRTYQNKRTSDYYIGQIPYTAERGTVHKSFQPALYKYYDATGHRSHGKSSEYGRQIRDLKVQKGRE